MGAGSGQSGQATVEWLGLVLMAALVLGALAIAGRGAADRDTGLGEAVAQRISCAARDMCGGAGPGGGPPGVAERRGAGVRVPRGAHRVAARPGRIPSKEADAFQRLRGVGGVARYAWIACLGYRGWRYELTHPRPPAQAMSLEEALDIANACLNPLAFLLP